MWQKHVFPLKYSAKDDEQGFGLTVIEVEEKKNYFLRVSSVKLKRASILNYIHSWDTFMLPL